MAEGDRVPKYDNVFRYLSDEPLAVLPEGLKMPLELRTTVEMMADRDRWLENSHQCPTCDGRGRVAN